MNFLGQVANQVPHIIPLGWRDQVEEQLEERRYNLIRAAEEGAAELPHKIRRSGAAARAATYAGAAATAIGGASYVINNAIREGQQHNPVDAAMQQAGAGYIASDGRGGIRILPTGGDDQRIPDAPGVAAPGGVPGYDRAARQMGAASRTNWKSHDLTMVLTMEPMMYCGWKVANCTHWKINLNTGNEDTPSTWPSVGTNPKSIDWTGIIAGTSIYQRNGRQIFLQCVEWKGYMEPQTNNALKTNWRLMLIYDKAMNNARRPDMNYYLDTTAVLGPATSQYWCWNTFAPEKMPNTEVLFDAIGTGATAVKSSTVRYGTPSSNICQACIPLRNRKVTYSVESATYPNNNMVTSGGLSLIGDGDNVINYGYNYYISGAVWYTEEPDPMWGC